MKFSEEIGKITLPGPKSVVRIFGQGDAPMFDLICLESEVEQIMANNTDLVYFTQKK